MFHVLSVQEILMITDWLGQPDSMADVGLTDITGWDPRMTYEYTDDQLDEFNSQLIALPDRIARKLRITKTPDLSYVDAIIRLLSNERTLHRAHLEEPIILGGSIGSSLQESISSIRFNKAS